MGQKEFVENIAERMIASQSDIDTPCARRAIIDFKITFPLSTLGRTLRYSSTIGAEMGLVMTQSLSALLLQVTTTPELPRTKTADHLPFKE